MNKQHLYTSYLVFTTVTGKRQTPAIVLADAPRAIDCTGDGVSVLKE